MCTCPGGMRQRERGYKRRDLAYFDHRRRGSNRGASVEVRTVGSRRYIGRAALRLEAHASPAGSKSCRKVASKPDAFREAIRSSDTRGAAPKVTGGTILASCRDGLPLPAPQKRSPKVTSRVLKALKTKNWCVRTFSREPASTFSPGVPARLRECRHRLDGVSAGISIVPASHNPLLKTAIRSVHLNPARW